MKTKCCVFLPLAEHRLLSTLYRLSTEGLYYCAFKKGLNELENCLNNGHDKFWFSYTVNAYYDMAMTRWSQLFGAYAEPSHYIKLLGFPMIIEKLVVADKDQLKEKLLSLSNLSVKEFDEYHTLTLNYRNRNLIHYEHNPQSINDGDLSYPRLDMAQCTLLSLLFMVINAAICFPKKEDKINTSQFVFKYVKSREELLFLIQNSVPVEISLLFNE